MTENDGERNPEMIRLVSMDWAMKRLLRSKANFDVLEGFLSELLHEDVTVLELLESETNREGPYDKQARMDLVARLASQEIVIIEIQSYTQPEYLPRILCYASQVISDHIKKGATYKDVVKIISVNLLFAQRGPGKDYIYYGRTCIEGCQTGKPYELSSHQQKKLLADSVEQIFPRYYLIYMNNFDDVAKDSLDEWIYFIKNQDVPESFSAKGLAKANKVFEIASMSENERMDYRSYDMDLWRRADEIEGANQKGREEVALSIARRLLTTHDDAAIAALTELSIEDVERLRAGEE